MLTVSEALHLLLSDTPAPRTAEVPSIEAEGAVLAEDVASDMDMPPFDKSMMDGFAVIAGDEGDLEIIEEIPAGHAPVRSVTRGTCAKIMTGAPMPNGADAVQQIERTARRADRVGLLERVRPGQNISPRGSEARKGDVVLRAGRPLGPAEMGVLAAVGRTRVRTYARPSCALIVTGDEIVEPETMPAPAQIRNSNASSLGAQVRAMGLSCNYLGIVRDDLGALRECVRKGLEHDVLLLTGGVSAGDWDFVIPALQSEGVRHSLHKVKIKPGKPLFYGTLGQKRIFGLPGNPVSTLVTFEVFVRPCLGRMMGKPSAGRPRVRARLLEALPKKVDREQYLPALVEVRDGAYWAAPIPWRGSADLFAVARGNGFVIVPIDATCEKGAEVEVMLFGSESGRS